ncbi:solute carrier family 46 member 3-like isoform X2 [Mercenaria mercenaria]|uniref:solute carrier family 46 member 3-like isoform X2 n=1 Tax=Mercenaria mercenaria TaxID=6596 RepID=UPI00234E70B4|nr:solute carrier family 46 member 3-like isoform X2 [Mercenaria mercenaria]
MEKQTIQSDINRLKNTVINGDASLSASGDSSDVTSFLGRIGTETIYQMSEPFCWSAEKVGWYGAARTIGMMVFGVGSVKVFQAFLPDVGIAIIGVLSYAVCFALTAFANNSSMLYIAAAASSFGPLESTIIRSVASSLTDPSQQGAIFAAFASVEIIVNLLSNVGTSAIYSVSVKFMRGFVFLVLSSFDGISVIFLVVLLLGWKREERKTTVVKI